MKNAARAVPPAARIHGPWRNLNLNLNLILNLNLNLNPPIYWSSGVCSRWEFDFLYINSNLISGNKFT